MRARVKVLGKFITLSRRLVACLSHCIVTRADEGYQLGVR